MKKLTTTFIIALVSTLPLSLSAQDANVGISDTITQHQDIDIPPGPGHLPQHFSLDENRVQPLGIYPNPAIGSEFTIDIPLSLDENIAVFIYNMRGQLMERRAGTYAELKEFRFRHLEEATYIIKVFSKDALFQSRVIVVHN